MCAKNVAQNHAPNRQDAKWRTALWLIVFGGSLFFWPTALDRYLAPRFFFLSVALLLSFWWLWKDFRSQRAERWQIFDLLLLLWYGWNLASLAWAFSLSEGIFYAQKTLLLFGVYWFLRAALSRNEALAVGTLRSITAWLTGVTCTVLWAQIGWSISNGGLSNEVLYEYASGLAGNKSLAAEFLFLLLVLQLFFSFSSSNAPKNLLQNSLLFGLPVLLILVLQVRTALLAMLAGAIFYCSVRAYQDAAFRKLFLRKILPLALVSLVALGGIMSWGGFATRLNPMNYLESDTANERRFVWHKTDLLNAEHFWLGVGDGSWKFWMPSKGVEGGYRLAEQNVVFTRAHNDYLEIRAELGILGVCLFCGLFVLAFYIAQKSPKKNLLPSIGLLGYCIVQFFDFPRERIEFQVVLAVLFALIVHSDRSSNLFAVGKWARVIWPILLLGFGFNLVLGWARWRGEWHNVRLANAQNRGDWQTVAKEARLAENLFYEYTDAALPLAWHEGTARFQLKEYPESVVAFERAYRLNPWSFQVINNYAAALVKSQRYAESVPLFEKALAINPRYDEGKFNLSFVYFHMADYTRSAEWLSHVDTIANPASDADRKKNANILKRREEFQRVLAEKQR